METVTKTGGRKKGTPKTGGRKKGTPNKITVMEREAVKPLAEKTDAYIQEEWEEFKKRMRNLDDKDYCAIFARLIQHRIPAFQSISFDKETNEALSREQLIVVRMSQDTKIKELDT